MANDQVGSNSIKDRMIADAMAQRLKNTGPQRPWGANSNPDYSSRSNAIFDSSLAHELDQKYPEAYQRKDIPYNPKVPDQPIHNVGNQIDPQMVYDMEEDKGLTPGSIPINYSALFNDKGKMYSGVTSPTSDGSPAITLNPFDSPGQISQDHAASFDHELNHGQAMEFGTDQAYPVGPQGDSESNQGYHFVDDDLGQLFPKEEKDALGMALQRFSGNSDDDVGSRSRMVQPNSPAVSDNELPQVQGTGLLSGAGEDDELQAILQKRQTQMNQAVLP